MDVIIIAGARPQFIKAAVLHSAMQKEPGLNPLLLLETFFASSSMKH